MRFSAPEQARGDSIRRQTAGTERFCLEQGLVLDETLCDRGISGFHGKNRIEGALGGFLRAFNSGLIAKNAVLIIESLDRLSREKTRLSQAELLQLVNAGLTVVTLLDQQIYSAETIDESPHLLHGALAIAQRAHEESATKARRVGEAWANKRHNLAQGRPSRQRFPAWLRWETDRVVVIPERQELLTRIFERRAAGAGRRRIIMELNERGIEPWGLGRRKARGGWQDSYLSKILSSRAVLGEFQPHHTVDGRRVPVGEPVLGFYPQVVSTELWNAAQTWSEPGTRVLRGRPSPGNLFSGLVFDPLGGPMHVARKGADWDYLVTALAYRRSDRPTFSWRLAHFQEVVLPMIAGLDWNRVFADAKHEEALTRLRASMAEISRAERQLEKKLERLTDAVMAGDLGAVGDNLRSRSQALTLERNQLVARALQVRAEMTAVEREQRASAAGGNRLREALKDLKDNATRERFQREVRMLVRRITLYPDGAVPGFPTDVIRRAAADLLRGNRGLVAKLAGEVCGAVRIEFCSGKDLLVWVTYRPGDRVREPATVLAVRGLGYETADWMDAARKLGISPAVAAVS